MLRREDAPSPALRGRLLAEHTQLRRLADDLDRAEGHARLIAARALGERLRDHVRFEERELFPHLETTLPRAALDDLGARLRRAHAAANYGAGAVHDADGEPQIAAEHR